MSVSPAPKLRRLVSSPANIAGGRKIIISYSRRENAPTTASVRAIPKRRAWDGSCNRDRNFWLLQGVCSHCQYPNLVFRGVLIARTRCENCRSMITLAFTK